MADLNLATAGSNAMLDALAALLDGGSVAFYTGPQPASADGAIVGKILLGKLTLSSPAAKAASAGVLTLAAITAQPAAFADGRATWARVSGGTGKTVFDCSVGGDREGTLGAIQLNTCEIAAGGPLSLSSFTLSF